jgi:hypothetical protein
MGGVLRTPARKRYFLLNTDLRLCGTLSLPVECSAVKGPPAAASVILLFIVWGTIPVLAIENET